MSAASAVLAMALAGASTSAVVVPGDPPLTERAIREARDFFEATLALRFEPLEVRSFREALVASWKGDPQGTHETLRDMTRDLAALRAKKGADAVAVRLAYEPHLLAALVDQEDDPAIAMVLAAWRKRNTVVADGQPPLTKKAAEAYLALVEFFIREATGRPPIDGEAREQALARISADYLAAPKEEQVEIAKSPSAIVVVRSAWRRLAPRDQAYFRAQWRAALRGPDAEPAPAPAVEEPKPDPGVTSQVEQFNFNMGQRLLMFNPFR